MKGRLTLSSSWHGLVAHTFAATAAPRCFPPLVVCRAQMTAAPADNPVWCSPAAGNSPVQIHKDQLRRMLTPWRDLTVRRATQHQGAACLTGPEWAVRWASLPLPSECRNACKPALHWHMLHVAFHQDVILCRWPSSSIESLTRGWAPGSQTCAHGVESAKGRWGGSLQRLQRLAQAGASRQ